MNGPTGRRDGGLDDITITAIDGADLVHEAGEWAFAQAERQRIADHWRKLKAKNPALWDGDVLMAFGPAIAGGRLSARLRTSDYASLVAWRDWGFADASAWNCFGTPVLVTGDGALIYGIMAGHTLNAGLAYPPSGSLETRDIGEDGRIDLAASMATEVGEETGLDLAEAEAGQMFAVFEARRLAIAQVYRLREPATAVIGRIETFIAAEAEPELAGVVALKCAADIERPMPPYARALARHLLAV